ncbi:MAG: ABC transporter ATP-binding protein [Ideonella sp.]|nr:ABC transporter ATP-binding protein [Ideonella sp.]
MKKVAVQCRNIRLAYGSTEVLKDVNLDIAPGEFFALLGPSGSGKSTLLRLIAGFNQHQQGQLLVDGLDITGRAPADRNIGMVFQSYALWPHLNVWDNVAFGLVERRLDRATIQAKVGAALDTVGLSAYGPRKPHQLSGGQQQRVALARTIVIEPQVLLLDEPLSNLDKTLRVQMRRELLALQRRLGITTIFVTHDQEEAMTTADRMAVLDKGVVQQVGTPMALYDEPANTFVAGFVGTMNQLQAQVRGWHAQTLTLALEGLGELQVPVPAARVEALAQARQVALCFRPHALQVVAADTPRDLHAPTADAQTLWLPGTVEAAEFMGESTRYRVRAGSQVLAVDQAHQPGRAQLTAGAPIRLGLAAAQLRLFAA